MSVLPVKSLKEHIFGLAERTPEKPALVSCNQEGETEKVYTYKDLKDEIVKVANWLQHDLGLHKGDVLGLALPNSIELLIVSWSAWATGIITVPLDMRRDTTSQHQYKLKLTKAKVVLANEEVSGLSKLPHAQKSVTWQKDLSHTALVLFTSGTTATPKGVELTLKNLLINAQSITEWFRVTADDRFLVLLPLYHINSTTFSLATLLAGGSIAVVPGYSNTKFWQHLAKTQSTFTSIVPTICYDQLSQADEFSKAKADLTINRIQIGSAPVVPHEAQKFMEQFAISLYQGYGQTETALRVTGVPMDLPRDLYAKLIQDNSIGKPMSWADVQVMDKKGNVLGEGQEGELGVKGPAVMAGYMENPEANKDAFKNSYFLTGDLGYYRLIDGVRYFFLKGRIKEIIIKGGVNISPVSIEARLKEMNENIGEVCVVGLPDARYGEEVAAVICWKNTSKPVSHLEAELKYQLTLPSQILAPFEVPHYIMSVEKSQIPLTPTGKVQRTLLKTLFPANVFQQVNLIASNGEWKFFRLRVSDKSYMKECFDLFNYCWQPLALDWETFLHAVNNGIFIIGVDFQNKVRGFIALLRTSLSATELCKLNYRELTGSLSLSTNQAQGNKIICLAIGVNSYQPQPRPLAGVMPFPTPNEMQEYLNSGLDLVYNFHKKPKAGLAGAQLVALLPNSRPEDTMSLGYNMLMKYPLISEAPTIKPNGNASLSVQLIETAMAFAQKLGIFEVYAFSRPAGAYQYFSSKK